MTKPNMTINQPSAKASTTIHIKQAAGMLMVIPLLFGHFAYSETSDHSDESVKQLIRRGEALRDSGALIDAQTQFEQALKSSDNSDNFVAALTASGYNQFLLNNMDLAEQQLKEAYQKSAKISPYLQALSAEYLGSLYLSQGADTKALRFFNTALEHAKIAHHPELAASIMLLKSNLALEEDMDGELITKQIADLPEGYAKARLQLQWAEVILDSDSSGLPDANKSALMASAYENLTDAQRVADTQKNSRFQAEVTMALARLYYQQQRYQDALVLADNGLALLASQQIRADELTVKLNKLKGDSYKQQGNKTAALQAYTQAKNTLALIKEELPINLPNGRSTVDALIDPVYRSYADLSLPSTETIKNEARQDAWIAAINSMEAVKYADLQNFFLTRCKSTSEQQHTDWTKQSFSGAVVLYPIIFEDRIELFLKSGERIYRESIPVSANQVKQQVDALLLALQDGKPYKSAATQLYKWLIAPLRNHLQQHANSIVVYVPDRSIRGMPLAALFDGEHFVAEQHAVVTLPSLTLDNLYLPKSTNVQKQTLIAGLSKPDGGSVDNLLSMEVSTLSGISKEPGRGLTDEKSRQLERSKMVEELSLPGVEIELDELSKITHSKPLLNKAFTADVFKAGLESAQYSNIHIGSHGYFGKNIKDSFVMAYDRNLSLQDFENSLKTEKLKQSPIELLTLSACETATGNDRMLLGFTGLAVKSNALSAVGSLWPINDAATTQFMTTLYKGLSQSMSKAQAMQQAQVAMIKSKDKLHHPAFWSPFVLVGNWQ